MQRNSILYWFLLIFIDFHWFFIDFHWFSLIFHPKTIKNPLKSFKILQNMCKIMQNHLINAQFSLKFTFNTLWKRQKSIIYWFLLIFPWFSLISIDVHWFPLNFYHKTTKNHSKSSEIVQILSKIMQNE